MKRLVYIAGAPGSGKTTLAAKLTAPYQRIPVLSEVNHDMLRDDETGHVIGAELGEWRGEFGGTDLLPASVIDAAVPWIGAITDYDLIIGEGQRLANKRFLLAARAAGYDVTLVLLDHADAAAWQRKRSRKLGRIQNQSWVQGRLNAARQLADFFDGASITGPGERVKVLRGHPDELLPQLEGVISADG
ncbi:adenylate kinase [Mycobacterium phage Indlovu]|nr:adenylate kinase [Mycobacterium phage Indlovu]